MRLAVVLIPIVVVISLRGSTHASPLVLDEADVKAQLGRLVERREEPPGLEAPADVPMLGLKKGDLVVSVNGFAAMRGPFGTNVLGDPVALWMDVRRGKASIDVRVDIRPGAKASTRKRPEVAERLKDSGASLGLEGLTVAGKPSAVYVTGASLLGAAVVYDGDVIRKIDGRVVKTVTEVVAALNKALPRPTVTLEMERVGRPYTLTMTLEDDLAADPKFVRLLESIQNVGGDAYEVPRALVDAVLAQPNVVASGVRIVPSVKDGKPDGFKLYAIRPSSLASKLGLSNGDTIRTINGVTLSSPDSPPSLHAIVKGAKQFRVEGTRRGKPLVLVWTVK